MTEVEFSDLLYGRVTLPEWILPFVRLPEFVRLRGVRLSNVDSFEFKDFNGPTRWEHGIAVAYLARICAEHRGLPEIQTVELILGALLHDVATPPFAHTAENVLENFDHEIETQRVLSATPSDHSDPNSPVFGSSLPRFREECSRLSRKLGVKIDPDEVARMAVGEGPNGFLISGTLDLDNADNVVRGCTHLGIPVDPGTPVEIARWLADQEYTPTDLPQVEVPIVHRWLGYRDMYYGKFFTSSDQELGRQAFLQHLMRRALASGLPRRVLIWNTDESLLNTIEHIPDGNNGGMLPSLGELVERYRLLEPTKKILEVPIDSAEILKTLRTPQVAAWIEQRLSTSSLECLVIVMSRRGGSSDSTCNGSLFGAARGSLLGFKLGTPLRPEHLPEWVGASPSLRGKRLRLALNTAVLKEIPAWVKDRPWIAVTQRRRESVIQNLESAGDWSFRLSRNEGLHTYPSTFVHAIPATLINTLGLKGELILDPFGGTGQTAVEVVKTDGRAISADSNAIATLVARAKLTPLSQQHRVCIESITAEDILGVDPCSPPDFKLREKWHHARTLEELCRVKQFISVVSDDVVQQFLLAAFSATIPNATGRRGKQHGFFADNTPLAGGTPAPPYQNAVDLFLARLKTNLNIIRRFYASLERGGGNPMEELARASVLQLDAMTALPDDYGMKPNTAAGLITSPPYLCMSDYSLGQRLSYYWIAPDALESDFEHEIGARRQRFLKGDPAERYFQAMEAFALNAASLVRPGGYLAMVLGEPVAKAFDSLKIVQRVDGIFNAVGFDLIWKCWRPIHWHRNQGYQRLRKERIAVYEFD